VIIKQKGVRKRRDLSTIWSYMVDNILTNFYRRTPNFVLKERMKKFYRWKGVKGKRMPMQHVNRIPGCITFLDLLKNRENTGRQFLSRKREWKRIQYYFMAVVPVLLFMTKAWVPCINKTRNNNTIKGKERPLIHFAHMENNNVTDEFFHSSVILFQPVLKTPAFWRTENQVNLIFFSLIF
jgi:hypothetical protein